MESPRFTLYSDKAGAAAGFVDYVLLSVALDEFIDALLAADQAEKLAELQ